MGKVFASMTLVFLLTVPVPKLPSLDGVPAALLPPEHTDVRIQHRDYVNAPLVELVRLREVERTSRLSGVGVRVSVERNPEHVYLVFTPESANGYRVDTAGTYILRRRRDNGEINQLKIFLHSDPRFFIRIRPRRDDLSLLTVYMAGSPVHQDIPVAMGVKTIMESSLERLLAVTAPLINWSEFFPDVEPERYAAVRLMASRAREALPSLPDAEDGAMDENGNLVFIESLVLQDQEPGFNCSGFAKWICDGIHMGLTGGYMDIASLKIKHPDLRGHQWSDPREDDRDPYFGLDWTRNLAVTLLSAERGTQMHPESADVRKVPYSVYTEDVGYGVERLDQIMYLLAISHPGDFYLASFNREFGEEPRLNQHVHVAVLFPFLDREGRYQTVVMERNVETSIDSLVQRYRQDHVHLVRVRASESYSPPLILN